MPTGNTSQLTLIPRTVSGHCFGSELVIETKPVPRSWLAIKQYWQSQDSNRAHALALSGRSLQWQNRQEQSFIFVLENIMIFHEYFSSYHTIMNSFNSAKCTCNLIACRYHLNNFQFPIGLLVRTIKSKQCCEINVEPQITLQSAKEACEFVDCPLSIFTAAGTESYSNTLCKYQAYILR